MARQYHNIKIVGLTKEEQLKALKPGRTYLLIENRSSGAIYINFDTHADANNGIQIPAGGNYEREIAVPDNDIYILGSDALNNQNINITEGYA